MPKSENPSAAQQGVHHSVIDGLPVAVEAILGVAKVKVGELSRLAPGDVFTLDALLGDPVELRLNGITIAHGELVSMDDRFAVRIRALAEP
jgi:flagellar motor switch protein FliN/FliY